MRHIMIAVAISAAATTSANAESYGKLFGGVALGADHDIVATIPGVGSGAGEFDTDTGYIVGGAYGANFSKFIAVEGEIAYRENDLNGGDVAGVPFDGDGELTSLSFMGNAIFKAPGYSGFTPYAGAGAGGARVGGADEHDFVFAWQAFGGVSREISPRINAGVEYRYFDADTATLNDPSGSIATDYNSHSINLTLTRKF